jgi:proteic killer suppression protein
VPFFCLRDVQRSVTLHAMIKSFRHKGLEKFFATGSKAGIQPKHTEILRKQLGFLHISKRPEDMNVPGWGWHALKGELMEHYAVWVSKNWRMTFKFEGDDAVLVDYRDYH